MSLSSLTVDLTLGLAKFEADSGKAAQIVTRDAEKMARATDKADAAIRRYTASFGRVGVEAKVVSAAVAGASDSALKLFANVESGGSAFSRVGSLGSAAFKAIGAAADVALQGTEARILAIADKARQVRDQAAKLTAGAVADNTAGTLSEDGLKKRLADIRAVQAAELERIAATASADADARRAARAEFLASSKALATAQVGSGSATAEAQTRVFLAFATAQAAAADAAAAAQARVAQAQAAATAASERGQAAQRAAYETKVAFIAKVNEEAAALFRTKDAQRALDAQRAGVSPEQAEKLAKFAGDREFLAGVRQQIDAQQRLSDGFSKTTAEILRQEAAERGLTNAAAGAISRFESLANANNAAAAAAAKRKNAESFLVGLNQTAAGIRDNGTLKSQSELLAEKAAILGVGNEAQAALAKIALLDGKTGQLGKTAFASRNQLLTLQYTISDVIASAGSGISPLTILLQQGPQLAQVEGGIGGIFRTALSLITPFRLAMGGAAVAIAAVGLAWFKGAEQSKAFNDAIVLSGNFAGQTEGQFNALTKSIAAGGQVTASAAREFGQALIATGEVGPAVFAKATEVAALYGQATGKTAKEVAQSFATMSQDAAKWATENNRSLNFVTAAQLEQIRALQEAGKSAEAQALVYDLLNKRLQALEPNLGTLDRAIRLVTGSWSKFWDAAFDIGRTENIEDKVIKARKALEQARAEAAAPPPRLLFNNQRAPTTSEKDANVAKAAARLDNELRDQQQQKNAAYLLATSAANNKAATEGRANVESLLKSGKAKSEFLKEQAKLERDLEKNRNVGTPFTAEEEKIARAELKKRFTDKGAVNDANAERKAQLDKDLQVFTAALAKEKDALKFQQDELKAIYDTGKLSLSKFYDDREATIKRGTLAELAEQAKAIGRIGDELKRGGLKKDERTKLEKQLAEAQAKATDIQRDADHAATLATYERAAAVKALALEVVNFQAGLKDLQGDPLGAAQLRAGQQLEAARTLAARATPAGGTAGDFARFDRGQSPVDLDAYARAIALGNDFAEVQRKVGVASANASRAEEAYLLRASTGRVGLVEQDQAVYAIRATALVQLGELRDKASALANAENSAALAAGRLADPKFAAAAADLALQYAKLARDVDPALNRLRANFDALASSAANALAASLADAGASFSKRRASNVAEVSAAKEHLQKRIEDLEGYLSRAGSSEEKARLRKRIAEIKDQKDRLQSESGFRTALKVLERDVAGPIVKQISASLTKTFIAEPLEQFLKGSLNNLVTGANPIGEFLRGAVGASVGAGAAGISQAAAAEATTLSISQLGLAAAQASVALQAIGGAQASTATTGGGGLFGFIGSLFGGGGGSIPGGVGAVPYHSGGLAGQGGAARMISASAFAGAQRYHAGGVIAGGPGLAANEVPAILMGGPRGTREEVLKATDPRHRDNMGAALLHLLVAGGGMRASAAGYTKPAVRYHSGGVVGMQFDGAGLMRGQQGGGGEDARQPRRRGGDTYNISVPPGTSRDTADQIASRVAMKIAAANRRNN